MTRVIISSPLFPVNYSRLFPSDTDDPTGRFRMIEKEKTPKFAEGIHCGDCEGRVRLMHARLPEKKSKGRVQVEFETVCVVCGRWDTVVRDSEFLPYSEREFCKKEKLPGFVGREKGQGVYHFR